VSSPSSSKPPVSSVSSVVPPFSSVKPVGVTVKPLAITVEEQKFLDWMSSLSEYAARLILNVERSTGTIDTELANKAMKDVNDKIEESCKNKTMSISDCANARDSMAFAGTWSDPVQQLAYSIGMMGLLLMGTPQEKTEYLRGQGACAREGLKIKNSSSGQGDWAECRGTMLNDKNAFGGPAMLPNAGLFKDEMMNNLPNPITLTQKYRQDLRNRNAVQGTILGASAIVFAGILVLAPATTLTTILTTSSIAGGFSLLGRGFAKNWQVSGQCLLNTFLLGFAMKSIGNLTQAMVNLPASWKLNPADVGEAVKGGGTVLFSSVIGLPGC
jgi:hypothetical protein